MKQTGTDLQVFWTKTDMNNGRRIVVPHRT